MFRVLGGLETAPAGLSRTLCSLHAGPCRSLAPDQMTEGLADALLQGALAGRVSCCCESSISMYPSRTGAAQHRVPTCCSAQLTALGIPDLPQTHRLQHRWAAPLEPNTGRGCAADVVRTPLASLVQLTAELADAVLELLPMKALAVLSATRKVRLQQTVSGTRRKAACNALVQQPSAGRLRKTGETRRSTCDSRYSSSVQAAHTVPLSGATVSGCKKH